MSITLDPRAEQEVAKEVEMAAQRVRMVILRNLKIAGDKSVKMARSMATQNPQGSGRPYTVQSGNLTSSIGYCITEDGQIVTMSSFQSIGGGKGDGVKGTITGQQYAKQIAAQFPKGYALILVAGMHYASYVQEIHHRDVLVSGTLLAEKLVNKLKTKFKQ